MRPFLVHQLLVRAAEKTPDALALVDPKSSLTYAALVAEAARVATALADLGVGPGDLVGLCLEKTAAAVACVYGILMRGAAYVPIDPSMPKARAARIVHHTGMRVVATSADRFGWFSEIRVQAPALERLLLVSGKAEEQAGGLVTAALSSFEARSKDRRDVTDGYLAYVLHTSGSTGQPKGVAITHANCLAFVEPATSRFDIGPSDRLACQAPLHFDLSVFDLYCGALAGAAVVLFPEYFSAFPKKMSQAIGQHGVTIWNSVVSAISLLLEGGKLADHPRDTLRAVLFSGERMPVPLLRRVREVLPAAKLYNVYGQTEANSSLVYEVAALPPSDDAVLPLGDPLQNFEVFVLGEDGAIVERDGVGELCVRAGTVASGGYLRDAERSRDKFVSDPVRPESGMRVYRTGDLARADSEGRLTLVGRRDDMVKTRGFRVELGEVEKALEKIDGLAEVAVVAVPSATIGNELRAYVTRASGASIDAADIAKRLAETLPAYMVPEPIEIRDALPRTSTGKIDKKVLATS